MDYVTGKEVRLFFCFLFLFVFLLFFWHVCRIPEREVEERTRQRLQERQDRPTAAVQAWVGQAVRLARRRRTAAINSRQQTAEGRGGEDHQLSNLRRQA